MTTYGRGKHPNSRTQFRNNIDVVLSKCVADLVTDCVLWTGSTHRKGYGSTCHNGRQVKVHRFVYEQLIGPIPDGLQLDHLCRVKCCVNPDHLEPVTNQVNSARDGAVRRAVTCTGCGGPREGKWMCARCRSNYNREYRRVQSV